MYVSLIILPTYRKKVPESTFDYIAHKQLANQRN